MKMKALRSFNHPETNVRVKNGTEFDVTDGTAREMEALGIAAKVAAKADNTRKTKVEPAPQNKAAEAGPLGSRGGETGETNLVSSSRVAPVRAKRGSTKSPAKSK